MKIKLKIISFIVLNSLALSGTTGKLVGKIMDKILEIPLSVVMSLLRILTWVHHPMNWVNIFY